jgi:hypothetical protein
VGQGSLADADEVGRLPLHLAAAADPVKVDLVPPEAASQLTTVVKLVLYSFPPAAAVVDHTGRLPLHYFLSTTTATGVAPSALLALVRAYPEALTVQDPVSRLYPVQQLAACCTIINSSRNSSPTATTTNDVHSNSSFKEMDLIYRLLRTCPDAVTYYRSQSANTSTRGTVMVHYHRCL